MLPPVLLGVTGEGSQGEYGVVAWWVPGVKSGASWCGGDTLCWRLPSALPKPGLVARWFAVVGGLDPPCGGPRVGKVEVDAAVEAMVA